MVLSYWANRTLIRRLVVRNIQSRYRGMLFGLAWSVGLPLTTALIYLFVFMNVLNVRWEGGDGSRAQYALILFAGLIIFNFFAECVNRAPGLMLEDASYIKRVVFPLEILAWVSILDALFHAALGSAVLLVCCVVLLGKIPLTALFAPVACLPLVFFTLGLTWFLSSLGVYLRDLKPLTQVATTLLLFLSPVFYPLSAVKGWTGTLLGWSPLAWAIEDVRNGLFFGVMPQWASFSFSLLLSLATAWLGYVWFLKTRQGFADVV